MALDFSAVSFVSGRRALQLAVYDDGSIEEIASMLAFEFADLRVNYCLDEPCDHHTALEVAACWGHIDAVERLLEAGAGPNAHGNCHGTSVLEGAARQGHLLVVQKILEKGENPNQFGKTKITPLRAATEAGHVEVCRSLLHAGADISIPEYGQSALAMAAEISNLVLLELYLGVFTDVAAGFEMNNLRAALAQGQRSELQRLAQTAEFLKRARNDIRNGLWAASRAGDMLILQRLLDADPGFDIRDAISAVARGGHIDAMMKLMQVSCDQNHLSSEDLTRALQNAVDAGHIALLEPLLEAGADATEISIGDAAANGHLDVLRVMLDRGARVERSGNENGYGTPLQWAVKGGHQAIVDLLLASGADVNAPAGARYPDDSGGTALQLAIAGGYTTMARQLLGAGADVNAYPEQHLHDEYYDTPLQAAARAGNIAILEMLLAAGATVDTIDRLSFLYDYWINTTLSVAAEANQSETVARLLALMSTEDARRTAAVALEKAVENRHTKIVRQLLQVHPDVDFRKSGEYDLRRPSVLQLAAANNDLEIVKILLEEQVDVNFDPSEGWEKTPLQSASAWGSLDVVKSLLASGAEVNVTGSTAPPLLLTIRNGHIKIFDLLLAAGADIYATSYLGQTMVQAAEDSGDTNMQKRVRDALNSRSQPPEEQPPARGTGPLCEACRTAPLVDYFCGRMGKVATVPAVIHCCYLGSTEHDKYRSSKRSGVHNRFQIILHPSLIALRASAVSGCPFCCFLWRLLDITSISLPQPSPVTLKLASDDPCAMICEATEPFGNPHSHSPGSLKAIFHFSVKSYRGMSALIKMLMFSYLCPEFKRQRIA